MTLDESNDELALRDRMAARRSISASADHPGDSSEAAQNAGSETGATPDEPTEQRGESPLRPAYRAYAQAEAIKAHELALRDRIAAQAAATIDRTHATIDPRTEAAEVRAEILARPTPIRPTITDLHPIGMELPPIIPPITILIDPTKELGLRTPS